QVTVQTCITSNWTCGQLKSATVGTPRFRWLRVEDDQYLTTPYVNGPFAGGWEIQGSSWARLPICRAHYRDGLHPGKIVDRNCNISWGGSEISITDRTQWNSLQVAGGSWIPASGSWDGAIISGYDSDGF